MGKAVTYSDDYKEKLYQFMAEINPKLEREEALKILEAYKKDRGL